MDAELLARMQFAFTIMFHYIYAPLSIGLSLILAIMEGFYIKTHNPLLKQIARFWTRILAITFVFGVASGIVMEFEFGTNWASYSRFVGDVFGNPLVAEGIFSFFLESVFLGILVFGWERVSSKVHFFSTAMVCLGAHLSALWIIVANSWMHTPAGFRIVGTGLQRHAEITDFWAMVFNPSMVNRLTHVVFGAWLAGAFLIISVGAYYLLKKKFQECGLAFLKVGIPIAAVSLILQLLTGDTSARRIAKYFPAKLAAYEGIFKTEQGAPMSIFGIVNAKEERIEYQLAIPNLLSLLVYGDKDAEIQGLDTVPPTDWPNVSIVFQTYHLMIATWVLMAGAVGCTMWYWLQKRLSDARWLLRLLPFSVLLPQIGNQAGWVATEMGRYPWIVYNHLRVSEGLSKTVPPEQILFSLILFTCVYAFLFALYLLLFSRVIFQGPRAETLNIRLQDNSGANV
jgi:cytochrome bd ubiquinol oxidase subunit I